MEPKITFTSNNSCCNPALKRTKTMEGLSPEVIKHRLPFQEPLDLKKEIKSVTDKNKALEKRIMLLESQIEALMIDHDEDYEEESDESEE